MSQLKLFHLQDSSKLKEEEEDGLEENGSGDPLDPGDALKRKLQSIIIQIDLLWEPLFLNLLWLALSFSSLIPGCPPGGSPVG